MSKKTIIIEPQETKDALIEAVNNAIGEALGVEPAEDGAVYPFDGAGIGFRCVEADTYTVGIEITNGITSNKPSPAYCDSFNQKKTYAVDVFVSIGGTAAAVGVHNSEAARPPSAVIAQSGTGGYAGLLIAGGVYYDLRNTDTTAKNYGLKETVTAPAYSLVKYPDFRCGAMFKELYLMMSAPQFPAGETSLYADGKTFQPIFPKRDTYAAITFAMPVGEG